MVLGTISLISRHLNILLNILFLCAVSYDEQNITAFNNDFI